MRRFSLPAGLLAVLLLMTACSSTSKQAGTSDTGPQATDASGAVLPGSTDDTDVPSGNPGSGPVLPLGTTVPSTARIHLRFVSQQSADVTDRATSVMDGRAKAFGGSATRDGDDIVVAVPSAALIATVRMLAVVGSASFRPVLQQFAPDDANVVAGGDDPAGTPTLPSQTSAGLTGYYKVGPSAVAGSMMSSASAAPSPNGTWEVHPVFKAGAEGIDGFNHVAADCAAKNAACPTGQVALVIDGNIAAAPGIRAASYQPDEVAFTNSFSENDAKVIAAVLASGPLPAEVTIAAGN